MSEAPDETFLAVVEQELQGLKPGSQRAVGGGVYMRLDRSGRRRFQNRTRVHGRQPGTTYDSWQEAFDAKAAAEAAPAGEVADGEPSAADLRSWTIEQYAQAAWWPTVQLECDALTLVDYKRGLRDLLPHVKGVTMAQLAGSPLLIDRVRAGIKAAKTYADQPGQAPCLHKAAADKPLKILSNIGAHATERDVFSRNPAAGVKRFNRRRSAAGDKNAPSHRPVLPSEIKHPRTVVLAGAGMLGDQLLIARRRIIPELIEIGMRPSDILAMRNNWWRDENGPKRFLHVDAAVKDLAGHLIEGEPKTGERDLILFTAVAESLEQIYQLSDCPDLGELTIPNAKGGLLDWGNWRQQVWYPSLHRAGIAGGALPTSPGAFWPYIVRHVGVTAMLHAQQPEGGTYSERQVARQFGHTVQTLDRVYADIPKDLHGIAGLTMDEVIRNARREIWGPMPGEADYQEVEYDLVQAQELTGISRNALAARLQRGSFPGEKRKGKWYITRFDLVWHGLLSL